MQENFGDWQTVVVRLRSVLVNGRLQDFLTYCQELYFDLLAAVPYEWLEWLTMNQLVTRKDEFLRIFTQPDDLVPAAIFETTSRFHLALSEMVTAIYLPPNLQSYSTRLVPRRVCYGLDHYLMHQMTNYITAVSSASGQLHQVNVTCHTWGSLLTCSLILDVGVGDTTASSMHIRPKRVASRCLSTQLTQPILNKWHMLLPADYKPRWCEVWHKHQPQKEVAFLQSMYHCAIAVNC